MPKQWKLLHLVYISKHFLGDKHHHRTHMALSHANCQTIETTYPTFPCLRMLFDCKGDLTKHDFSTNKNCKGPVAYLHLAKWHMYLQLNIFSIVWMFKHATSKSLKLELTQVLALLLCDDFKIGQCCGWTALSLRSHWTCSLRVTRGRLDQMVLKETGVQLGWKERKDILGLLDWWVWGWVSKQPASVYQLPFHSALLKR